MPTTCQEIAPLVSQLVDRALGPDEEAVVREHLRGCAACRGLMSDLERLRRTARDLGPLSPPGHVWLEVAGQIHRSDPARVAVATRGRPAPVWQWAGLAAALVLITGALYFVQRLPSQGGAADNAPLPGSVEVVADELNLAAAHYERAIAELDALSRSGEGPVDAAAVSVMRENLDAIDTAIAESRAALASNPQSEPARDSLFDALRRKITVLQMTVSLLNEIRAGDANGAQQAAETLRKPS